MDHCQNNDEAILTLLKEDDTRAIDILYDLYYDKMIRIAFKVIGDSEVAKDIVQELFLNIWSKRHQVNITKPIMSYLAKSMINRCLNYLRDYKRSQLKYAYVTYENVKNTGDESLIYDDLIGLAKIALDSLPPKCRLIFSLSRSEEMSYSEIATYLGISKKAVEKQMTRALKHLRKHLSPYLYAFSCLALI